MHCVKLKNENTELNICLARGKKTGNAKWKLDSLTKCFETHTVERMKFTHNERFKEGS